jgi:hypothetical protein
LLYVFIVVFILNSTMETTGSYKSLLGFRIHSSTVAIMTTIIYIMTIASGLMLFLYGIDDYIPLFSLLTLILSAVYVVMFNISLVISFILQIITQVIYPLINIILSLLAIVALAAVPGSVLLVASLFTCPEEKSFDTWLTSFIAFQMDDAPKPPVDDQDANSKSSWIWPISCASSYASKSWESTKDYAFKKFMPTIMSKTMLTDRKFMYGGVCRILKCKITGSDSKDMMFIGVFHTWIPYK